MPTETDEVTRIFDSFDPISILSFLSAFKLAFDASDVHMGDAFSLLHFVMKRSAASRLELNLN